MIRDNDLKSCEGTNCYFSGAAAEKINLKLVEELLKEKNDAQYGLPIQFGRDEVKHGGLLNATKETCLTIVNQTHPGRLISSTASFFANKETRFGFSASTTGKAS